MDEALRQIGILAGGVAVKRNQEGARHDSRVSD